MNRYITFLFALISFELLGQAGVSPAKEVNISPGRNGVPPRKSTSRKPQDPRHLPTSKSAMLLFLTNTEIAIVSLMPNEEAEISFTLSNVGKGNALALAANVVPIKPDERH